MEQRLVKKIITLKLMSMMLIFVQQWNETGSWALHRPRIWGAVLYLFSLWYVQTYAPPTQLLDS